MNNELKSRVSLGMTVRTRDGKALGRVTTLHGDTFEIESRVFLNRDYTAAFDEVVRIDGEDVFLSLSEDELAEMRARGGVGTALADRAAGVLDHTRAALGEAIHAGRRPTVKKD